LASAAQSLNMRVPGDEALLLHKILRYNSSLPKALPHTME
jgi:hypothetical protein